MVAMSIVMFFASGLMVIIWPVVNLASDRRFQLVVSVHLPITTAVEKSLVSPKSWAIIVYSDPRHSAGSSSDMAIGTSFGLSKWI